MILLVAGLALFFGTHFFTALARGGREAMIRRLGAGPYRGLYSLTALAGFALIIIGWRQADPTLVYAPPAWLRHATLTLMPFATVLIIAAFAPAGRIVATVKHPMLAAVKIWAFAHLLSNGELRSILLFGSFLAFAVIDRIAVNRRDAPVRSAGPLANDAIAVMAGLALYAVIYFWAHPWIAGVALSS